MQHLLRQLSEALARVRAAGSGIVASLHSALSGMGQAAGLNARAAARLIAPEPETWYDVECRDAAGNLRWAERFHNLVTTVGKNKLLDATFKTGLASPAWYVGLVDNASFSAYAAADTMASHAGWIEGVPYSDATRQALTPGTVAAGSVDNSASKAVFNINATLTVRGCFLVDNSTKSGSTGVLYGVGDFAASRAVLSGDTLSVTVTLSIT